MRRGPAAAVLLCLVGAFVVLVGVGRAWTAVDVAVGPIVPPRTVQVPGSELAPGVQALGLVGLAGVVALAATRRWGRVVVGALLLLTGLGVLAVVLGTDPATATLRAPTVTEAGGAVDGEVRTTVWRWVTAAGGLLVAAAGALVAARGRRWAALGRRYEPPVPAPTQAPGPPQAPGGPPQASGGPPPERELWEALDRGEDPTTAPRQEGSGGRLA